MHNIFLISLHFLSFFLSIQLIERIYRRLEDRLENTNNEYVNAQTRPLTDLEQLTLAGKLYSNHSSLHIHKAFDQSQWSILSSSRNLLIHEIHHQSDARSSSTKNGGRLHAGFNYRFILLLITILSGAYYCINQSQACFTPLQPCIMRRYCTTGIIFYKTLDNSSFSILLLHNYSLDWHTEEH